MNFRPVEFRFTQIGNQLSAVSSSPLLHVWTGAFDQQARRRIRVQEIRSRADASVDHGPQLFSGLRPKRRPLPHHGGHDARQFLHQRNRNGVHGHAEKAQRRFRAMDTQQRNHLVVRNTPSWKRQVNFNSKSTPKINN